MGRAQSNREVEIKLRVPDAGAGRRLLRRAGFRVRRRRVFESNVLYDTPAGALRSAGKLLRIRRVGSTTLLTYKGPALPGKHKIREEFELRLSDAESFGLVMQRLGMRPAFRYEKYRTEYAGPAPAGVATLDETPIGAFLELEGAPGWIDATARTLGFQEQDYITASYGRLFLESLGGQAAAVRDMVFDTPAT